jgi:hypothetical protein
MLRSATKPGSAGVIIQKLWFDMNQSYSLSRSIEKEQTGLFLKFSAENQLC